MLAGGAVVLALRLPDKRFVFDADLFKPFQPVTKLAFVLSAALAYAWLRYGRRCANAIERVPSFVFVVLLFALTTWMVHGTTIHAFAGVPQVQDEIAYDQLAKNLANGTPVPTSHALSEFFRVRFVVDDGHVYPLFQPGWPLFLALARKAHLNLWAPAIATALFVVATFRLGDRVHGRTTGLFAALLLLISPFVHYLGASYFAHAFAGALFLLAIERGFAVVQAHRRREQREAIRFAIGCGLVCALLFFTRLQTAAALVAPLTMLAVILVRRGGARRPIAWFFAVALLGPLAQIGWNLATTHHAFELPQDRWFALTEANPDCHRLGFGPDVGCRREHPLDVPDGDGFTISRAIAVTSMRWSVLRRDTWGTALPFAFVALVLLRKPRKRDLVLLTAALAPIAVYFGFYYHALDHGARLYLEVVPPLAILLASALTVPLERPEEHESPRGSALLGAGALFLLLPLGVSELAKDLPDRVAETGKDPQAPRITRNLDAANVHHAVLYVVNCDENADRADVVYGWSSVLNGLHLETNDRIFVRDFGFAHDQQLGATMPGWDHLRIDCSGYPLDHLFIPPSLRTLVSELEAKFPPDAVHDAWGRIETDEAASNRAVLTITTTAADARMDFRQYVSVDATYRFSALVRRRIDGGKITLVVDGVPLTPPLETQGGDDRIRWVASTTMHLSPGVHHLAFQSAGQEGKHSIDRLQIEALD